VAIMTVTRKGEKQGRILGVSSILLSLIFWLPITYAYVGMTYVSHLPQFYIPMNLVFAALMLSVTVAIIAAIRGSRWWLVVAISPLLAFGFFVRAIQG
jgi:hypothetical protein